ncbi:MAG: SLOG family protein [Actinomycetota bacterium]
MTRTTVYTDGACSGNPGPGGWAWVVPDGEAAYGGADETTNQRMELQAVLEAVTSLPGPLHIVSDSTYVVNCFRDSWWRGWLKRDWKNSQKKPVANRDLWEPLIEEYQRRDLEFEWVKGHSGDRWNDRADELAVLGRDEASGKRPPGDTAAASNEASDRVDDLTTRRIAVVGHRPPELGGYEKNPVAESVRRRLVEIFVAKAQMFERVEVLTGLQLGTETLAAEAAIESGVEFVAVLAFPDPAARWPKPTQAAFDELLDQAVDVVVVDSSVPKSAAEAGKAFGARDRWLHDRADEAIVVFDGEHRGVGAQARSFERALGEDVWILDPATV